MFIITYSNFLQVLHVAQSVPAGEPNKVIQSYVEPRNTSTRAEWKSESDSAQRAIMFETGRTVEADKCSFPDDPAVDFGLDQAFGSSNLNTVFISIPLTSFSCQNRATGYYADKDSRTACRVSFLFISSAL